MTGGAPHEAEWRTSMARHGAVDPSPGKEGFRDEQEGEKSS
jgi:hypothetical protein